MKDDSLFTFTMYPAWCVNVNVITGIFFSFPFVVVVRGGETEEEKRNGIHTVKCLSLSKANCILISFDDCSFPSSSSSVVVINECEVGFSTLYATILFLPKLGQCFSKTSIHCVRCLDDFRCIRLLVGTISPRCKSPFTTSSVAIIDD